MNQKYNALKSGSFVTLQHPDDKEALTEAETVDEALRIMRLVEKEKGLKPILEAKDASTVHR